MRVGPRPGQARCFLGGCDMLLGTLVVIALVALILWGRCSLTARDRGRDSPALIGPLDLLQRRDAAGGIALIVGLFTGLAALGAALLNFNFMLAGSAGVNPVYFLLAVLLVLAWKNAGWWGLDRFVLPALGTPWHGGPIFHRTVPPVPFAPEA